MIGSSPVWQVRSSHLTPDQLGYRLPALQQGQPYYASVQTVDSGGRVSAWSSEVRFDTTGELPPVPTLPARIGGLITIDGTVQSPHPALLPLVTISGVVLLTVTLHLARGIGYLHGQLAKKLLVHAPRAADEPAVA